MAMQALRDGASGGILKFILLGLLALAAGGLVFTDVGGFFRGGVSGNDVAKVSGESISINTFDRLVRRTLAQLGISPQQAYQMGYMQEILNSEIRRRLLLKAAEENGIVVDKSHVVEQIQDIIAPALQQNMSAEQALQNLLRNQGFTENELIHSIQSERTIALLSRALQSGALDIINGQTNDLYQFQSETRDIKFIEFLEKDYTNIEDPTDEELLSLYDGTKEAYANAETRTIRLLTLNIDKIKDTLQVDETILKDRYEENIEYYTTPESRTITQATAQSEENAQKIYDAIQSGKSLKDALQAVTGRTSALIPAKAFQEGNILEELKEPVFSAEKTGALEPIKTPLGWNIVEITRIEDQIVVDFEKAKKEIREDILADRLIDEAYTIVDEIDEVFASGGSIDDAIKQYGLTTTTFENLNMYGQNAKKDTPLNPALGPDAQTALQTAFELEDGQTSMMFELKDGNFAAIQIQNIKPKTYQEFEDVKGELKTAWINDQKSFGNKAFVMGLEKTSAGKSLADIAKENGKRVKSMNNIKRDDEPKAPISIRGQSVLFEVPLNNPAIIDIDGGLALAIVTDIALPKNDTEKELAAIKDETLKDMQNETFISYINEQQEKHKASINVDLLKRAYGTQTESF